MELRRWVILVCLSQCLLATPGAAKKKLEIITEVERATIIYMLSMKAYQCHVYLILIFLQSKPQECTQFVESGDTLRVHYTVSSPFTVIPVKVVR